MLRAGLFDHHTTDPYIVATAAGTTVLAQGFWGPCPQGYNWYVESVTSHVNNTHTAVVELAISGAQSLPVSASWDRGNREWWGGAATDANVQPGLAWYVPEGYYIVAFWTAGTMVAGDIATLGLQLAVHQLNPHVMQSPEDRQQVHAAHELEAAELPPPATAFRRAV